MLPGATARHRYERSGETTSTGGTLNSVARPERPATPGVSPVTVTVSATDSGLGNSESAGGAAAAVGGGAAGTAADCATPATGCGSGGTGAGVVTMVVGGACAFPANASRR